jgi:sigma-B regulation protein RsbU (phosphoserine phosphatase)
MPAAPPTSPSRPPWYRQLVLAVAVAVPFAAVVQLLFGGSLVGFGESLATVLIYSLCLGGVFTLALPLVEPRVSSARFPFDWMLFLALYTLLTGVALAIASFVVYAIGIVPGRMDWEKLVFINRLVLGLTLLFGSFAFLYDKMKSQLAARNLELQRDLEHESRQAQAREQELEQAREIQEALVPKELPRIGGFGLSGAWQPARTVSGDYFDVLDLAEDAIGLCIADVVGKGISAALLMSNLQAAVKAFASPTTSPAQLCERVNQVITSHVADGKFITFFYGLLDPGAGRLSYCCAGHNPPMVVRRDGSVLRLEEGGLVLGVLPNGRYEEGELATASGDLLLLFTDGVTEAKNAAEEEFGDERLISLILEDRNIGAKQLTQKVLATVTQFSQSSLADDATLLALSVE